MRRGRGLTVVCLFVAVLAVAGFSACGGGGGSTSTPSATSTSPTATETGGGGTEGQVLVNERCTKCHDVTRIETAHKTADEWQATVERMVANGARLNEQERQAVVDYLAATYGP